MIPKIIHQIWYQGEDKIPLDYPNYSKSWKVLNADFKYMFWDEQKIIKLIYNNYPHLIKKFNEYPKMIQRIDFAKYIILHHYGGVYIDIDSECFKPISNLLNDKDVLLVELDMSLFSKILIYKKIHGYALQNGVMAGAKKNPFWMHCINLLLKEDLNKKYYETELLYVFRTTGPLILTNAYNEYRDKKNIRIVPHNIVDPLSWCEYEKYECDKKSCGNIFPDAYSLHHYGSKSEHSWTSKTEKTIGLWFCKYDKYLLLICIIIIFTIILYCVNK